MAIKQSFPLVFLCIFGNSLFYKDFSSVLVLCVVNSLFYKDFPSVLVVVFCVAEVYICLYSGCCIGCVMCCRRYGNSLFYIDLPNLFVPVFCVVDLHARGIYMSLFWWLYWLCDVLSKICHTNYKYCNVFGVLVYVWNFIIL